MSATMGKAAVAYVERLQWPVFPVFEAVDGDCSCPASSRTREATGRCSRPGKHPRTAHGLLESTLDPTLVARWWRDYPQANIGVLTGSERVVLDVDVTRGGEESLHALERLHGCLPLTPRQRTGGGGWHYVLSVTGVDVPNKVDLPGYPGLDVRGVGGFIVVSPSAHISGREYVWEVDAHPLETPIAPMPSWLLALILAARSKRLRRDGTPLEIANGERNDRLFRVGCLFRRLGLNESAIRDALLAVNREHAKPPLTPDEVRAIALSVARYAPGDVRP